MSVEANTASLEDRIAALESESEIRGVVARYMEICDDLGPDAPMEELGQLFSKNAIWEGAGARYKSTFGGHNGREAIVKFLETYQSPTPHFQSNVHFLTSETVTVNGDNAVGSWVMLQTPSFSNGESFVLAARLSLEFAKEEGRWCISKFKTANLFGRPIEGGWHSAAPIPKPDHKNS